MRILTPYSPAEAHGFPERFFTVFQIFCRRFSACLLLLGLSGNFSLLRAQTPLIQWDKTFGGLNHDELSSIVPTPDGGYLLGGITRFGAGGNKTEPTAGYWLIKTDASGNLLWQKVFDDLGGDKLPPIVPTPDGNYLIGGSSLATDGESQAYAIKKIDGSGNTLWEKAYGSGGFNFLSSIVPTPEGGYLLGGSTESGIGGDKTEGSRGGVDYWVVKVDAAGAKLWDKTFGGNSGDRLSTAVATPDGGYLLGGDSDSGISGDKTEENEGERDYWVVKISGAGAKLWDKTYGGSGFEELNTAVLTPEGGYLIGGGSNSGVNGDRSAPNRGESDFWLLKIDSSGNKGWDKAFGGSDGDWLTSIVPVPDGGYLLGGYSLSGISGDRSEPSRGYSDFWTVRIDATGNKHWDKAYGGEGGDVLYSIVPTPDGGHLLGGYSWSGISGEKSEANVDGRGYNDFWIVKTSPEGAGAKPVVTSFTLVNADTDEDIGPLRHGDVLDLATLPTANLNVRANVSPGQVGSVVFLLDRTPRVIENHAPYALFGNTGNDYNPGQLALGRHRLRATPYARTYGQGPAGIALDVSFTVVNGPTVLSFTLLNADTNQDLMELQQGDVIDLATLGTPNLNVRANTYPARVGSVMFHLDRTPRVIENHAPYALFGNTGNDYNPGQLALGRHRLQATPYPNTFGQGPAGTTLSVYFRVTDGMRVSQAAAAAGVPDGYGAFPNPFIDRLKLQLGQTGEQVQVTLTDGLGRMVYQKELAQPAGVVELDLSGQRLPAGLYFLRLAPAGGGTQVFRLMKR